MIVIFLQNAWSPLYAGGPWPRDSWLKALWRSPTGQRLAYLTEPLTEAGLAWHVDNTTPIVGAKPDSVVPADLDHMGAIIRTLAPGTIVACGKLAQTAVESLRLTCGGGWTMVPLQHPAYRYGSDAHFKDAAEKLVANGAHPKPM